MPPLKDVWKFLEEGAVVFQAFNISFSFEFLENYKRDVSK